MSPSVGSKYVPPHRRRPDIAKNLGPVELSLYERSPALRRLIHLKEKVSNDPVIEVYFQKKRSRDASGAPDSRRSVGRRNQYSKTAAEIDHVGGSVLLNVRRFLDLGSGPGGFSKWIVDRNAEARGIGVTLGSPCMRPMIFKGWSESSRPRYELVEGDVTDTGVAASIGEKVKALGGCDLVLAGAVYYEPNQAVGDAVSKESIAARDVLQLSQLILALRNLDEGGCLVANLYLKPFPSTMALFFLLREAFDCVIAIKPVISHRARTSYYLVCRSRKADVGEVIKRLESVLKEVSERGEPSNWVDLLGGPDKTCLTSDEEALFLTHMEPMWTKQADVLRGMWERQHGLRMGGEPRKGRTYGTTWKQCVDPTRAERSWRTSYGAS